MVGMVWSIVQIFLSILYLDELAQKGKYFFQYTYGVKPAANSIMSIQCGGRYIMFLAALIKQTKLKFLMALGILVIRRE